MTQHPVCVRADGKLEAEAAIALSSISRRYEQPAAVSEPSSHHSSTCSWKNVPLLPCGGKSVPTADWLLTGRLHSTTETQGLSVPQPEALHSFTQKQHAELQTGSFTLQWTRGPAANMVTQRQRPEPSLNPACFQMFPLESSSDSYAGCCSCRMQWSPQARWDI